jgi:hypothetical protein
MRHYRRVAAVWHNHNRIIESTRNNPPHSLYWILAWQLHLFYSNTMMGASFLPWARNTTKTTIRTTTAVEEEEDTTVPVPPLPPQPQPLLPPPPPQPYGALAALDPQVVSLTFYRDPSEIPRRRLGFRLSKTMDEGGDIRIAELDGRPDSILLTSMPIDVGDLLVAVNQVACYGTHFYQIQETIAITSGLMTLHIRKTTAAPLQDELRQALFVLPPLLPAMEFIEFRTSSSMRMRHSTTTTTTTGGAGGVLTIASIHKDNGTTNTNNTTSWLTSSCLEQGQVVLSINDIPSYDLEPEDAQLFLRTKATLTPHISIKTYAPARHKDIRSDIGVEEDNDVTPPPWRFGDRLRGRRRQSNSSKSGNPTMNGGSHSTTTTSAAVASPAKANSPSNNNNTNGSRTDNNKNGNNGSTNTNTSRQRLYEQQAGHSTSPFNCSRTSNHTNSNSRRNLHHQPQDVAAAKGTVNVNVNVAAAAEWRQQSLEDTI